MNNQELKQLAMQGYQRFQSKDIAGLLELLTDDIEWVSAEHDELPFAGIHRGKQEVAQYFTELDRSQEAQLFEPQTMIAEDDRVAVMGRSRWTVRATGQTYDNPWVHIFTVRDGKVCRFEQYNDTAAALKAFQGMQSATQQAGQSATPLH
ncbi:MAG TPA: nuclear transport factor 2 family protein [Noviherbaspirillum sp.]|uniref:nuclear transport factor 2 family protein n=1 Tax=Noviherbaspirillum sp. TaxID=1926288 RepID=UPI002D4D8319|nr:nuclear transport factor 2 family protein [Noviherbaspirillum sp.]HYD97600.1 nuclear transport factor 2 family protein [Noviherbaspirillum sp.]